MDNTAFHNVMLGHYSFLAAALLFSCNCVLVTAIAMNNLQLCYGWLNNTTHLVM